MQPEQAGRLLRQSNSSWNEQRAQRVKADVLQELRAAREQGVRLELHHSRPESERQPSGVRRRVWAPALLAAAAITAAMLLYFQPNSTLEGKIRVGLTDGSSVVALEPNTEVVPELVSEHRVELRQSSGAAEYDVTPALGRVFIVHVDDARVEVLGTVFRVVRDGTVIRVMVSRGRVRVTRGDSVVALLNAGEDVTLAPPAETEVAAATRTVEPEPADAEPEPSAEAVLPKPPSAAELFERADRARTSGDVTQALSYLRQLVRLHKHGDQTTLAYFTIGRLEAARGRHQVAANAFEACGTALAGEAVAEAALSWAAVGREARSKALARKYLRLFPKGPRAQSLAKLAE